LANLLAATFLRRNAMQTLTTIITWAVFGLVIGIIARFLYPGKQPMSLLMTMILGIVGSFVGGLISWAFGFQPLPGQPPHARHAGPLIGARSSRQSVPRAPKVAQFDDLDLGDRRGCQDSAHFARRGKILQHFVPAAVAQHAQLVRVPVGIHPDDRHDSARRVGTIDC
jgi:uncharacterized membrane protein YeaQ/YmgE (transglycosylase-associated protein family)